MGLFDWLFGKKRAAVVLPASAQSVTPQESPAPSSEPAGASATSPESAAPRYPGPDPAAVRMHIRSVGIDLEVLLQEAIRAAQADSLWGLYLAKDMPALLRVAVLLSLSGSPDQACQLCREALHKLLAMNPNEKRREAKQYKWERSYRDFLVGEHWVAKAQAEAGLYSEAMKTASGILDERSLPNERELAFIGIIEAQVSASHIREAEKTMGYLKGWGGKTSALNLIAQGKAQSGAVSEALRTVKQIRDGPNDATLRAIGLAQARAGNFTEARQTLETVRDPSYAAPALGELALCQFQARMTEAASDTLGAAIQRVERLGAAEGTSLLASLTRACVQLDQMAAAAKVADSIGPPREGWGYFGRMPQVRDILAVGQGLARAGQTAPAESILTKALSAPKQYAPTADGVVDNVWTLCQIACIHSELGIAQAAQPFDEAYRKARERSGVCSARALCAIAEAKARLGDRDAVATALNEARERMPESIIERDWALMAISKAQAQCDMLDRARNTLADIRDGSRRADALRAIADSEMRAGLQDKASATLREAVETLLNTDTSNTSRDKMLGDTARTQFRFGFLSEAINTAKSLDDANAKAALLVEVTQALFDYARKHLTEKSNESPL